MARRPLRDRFTPLALIATLFLVSAPSIAVEVDTDFDGIPDVRDNCVAHPNPDQTDTDLDGYGQVCDPDYNNDGVVGAPDFNRFRGAFGKADAGADLTGDGVVGAEDFNVFRALFGQAPGPSGLSCAGTVPCGYDEEGWLPGKTGPMWSSYRVVGDQVFFQFDMVYPLAFVREFQADLPDTPDGNVTHSTYVQRLWPDGVIPYAIDPAFPADTDNADTNTLRDRIAWAVDHWNQNSLVQLVPMTNEADFVTIAYGPGGGCWAHVGKYSGGQTISLADTCSRGNAVHEIGHTLGFWHEQMSSERDGYVEVLWDNIEEGREDQFVYAGTHWGEYNLASIMHYPDWAFSDNGSPTLQPLVPLPGGVMGQRDGLSRGDIAAANALARGQFGIPLLGQTSGGVNSDYNSLSNLALVDFAVGAASYHAGDFDGDGLTDVLAFSRALPVPGPVRVALAVEPDPDSPDRIEVRHQDAGVWLANFCFADEICRVGDVNGDGRDDVLAISPSNGHVWVATSNGSGFNAARAWHNKLGLHGYDDVYLADVDGDCRDDLVGAVYSGDPAWSVYFSEGSDFGNPDAWTTTFGFMYSGQQLLVGDLDGDERADLAFHDALGRIYFAHSNGRYGMASQKYWGSGPCEGSATCRLADMNDDGRDDVVGMWADAWHEVPLPSGDADAYYHALDRVRVGLSTGKAISQANNFHEIDCRNPEGCLLGDANGDGHVDVLDPIRPERTELENGRYAGDVFVSLSTGITTDSIGTTYTAFNPFPAVCPIPVGSCQNCN